MKECCLQPHRHECQAPTMLREVEHDVHFSSWQTGKSCALKCLSPWNNCFRKQLCCLRFRNIAEQNRSLETASSQCNFNKLDSVNSSWIIKWIFLKNCGLMGDLGGRQLWNTYTAQCSSSKWVQSRVGKSHLPNPKRGDWYIHETSPVCIVEFRTGQCSTWACTTASKAKLASVRLPLHMRGVKIQVTLKWSVNFEYSCLGSSMLKI